MKYHKVNKDIRFQKECDLFGIPSKFNCIKISKDDYFDLKVSKNLKRDLFIYEINYKYRFFQELQDFVCQ